MTGEVRNVLCTVLGKKCTLACIFNDNFKVIASRRGDARYLRNSQFICECRKDVTGITYAIMQLPGGSYVKAKESDFLYGG